MTLMDLKDKWRSLSPSDLLLALGAAGLFVWSWLLVCLSWGKWPDVLVDFGRELYIPWQLSEGKVLYRDIYFYYGPLSKYLHAFLFKIFSPSLFLLVIANFIILSLFSWLIYRVLRVFSSVGVSCFALGVFLSLFAFAQYVGIANYNFICPYSHEIVHGVVLSFLALVLLLRYMHKPCARRILAAGICFGMVFLTKVEIFVALTGSLFVGVCALAYMKRKAEARAVRLTHLWLFFSAALVPSVLFWMYFAFHMGPVQALSAVLLPYKAVVASKVQANLLYQRLSGLFDLSGSLLSMGKVFLGYFAAAGIIFMSAWTLRQRPRWIRGAVGGIFLLIWAILCWKVALYHMPAFEMFRPLPLIGIISVVSLAVHFLRRGHIEDPQGSLFRLVFAVFSLLLLLKIIFYGHIFHYGFILAAPAVLLTVVLVLEGAGALGRKAGTGQALIMAMLLVLMAVVIFSYGRITHYYYAAKTSSFGDGADRFLTYASRSSDHGPGLLAALEFLRSTPPGSTVAVFPEGVMLNYMSRRSNPTPFFEFAPGFFNMVPEAEVLKAFKVSPPDYVVLVDRDMREYGARFFGRDYAQSFLPWISGNYMMIKQIGAVPFSENGFWVWIGVRIGKN